MKRKQQINYKASPKRTRYNKFDNNKHHRKFLESKRVQVETFEELEDVKKDRWKLAIKKTNTEFIALLIIIAMFMIFA